MEHGSVCTISHYQGHGKHPHKPEWVVDTQYNPNLTEEVAIGFCTMEEIMYHQVQEPAWKQNIYIAVNDDTFKPVPGAVIRGYLLTTQIGRGASGVVYKVYQRKTGKFFAMKVLDRRAGQKEGMDEGVLNEVNFLTSMTHPNIVKAHECINTRTHTLLVMDLASNGSLVGVYEKGPLYERCVHSYMCPIIQAVNHLHRNCIQHLDMKLDNILIDSCGNTLLSDFGTSVRVSQRGEKVRVEKGTRGYLAPELLRSKINCGELADAYALGVCVYTLVHGQFPEWDIAKELVFHDGVSHMLRDFLTRALRTEPTTRLSVAEMLEHPWAANAQVDSLGRSSSRNRP